MSQTKLAFDAKIAGVTVRPPKDAGSEGRFDLTLTIDQPNPPTAPTVPWKFAADGVRGVWKDRPEDLPDEAAEQDERRREQERYDADRAEYDQHLADFNRNLADYRERLMAYAQVVGISSIFGRQTVTVVLMPSNQDLIPGFAAELTSDTSHALLMAEAAEHSSEAATRTARSRPR